MQPKYYGAAADYNRPKRGLQLDKRLLMMIGGGVVVLIFIAIGFSLLNAAASAPKNDLQTLVARESSLGNFLKNNQSSVQSQSLIRLSADAQLLIAGNKYTLLSLLTSQYDVDKIAEEFTAAEADTTSASTLSTARINGKFDSTFVDLLQDKLAATQTLAQKIKDSANSEIGVGLDATIKTMQSLSKRLQDLQL